MSGQSAPGNTALRDDAVTEDFVAVLAEIAECEAEFCTRFYEVFFEQRPDARPLFGAHSLPEQEEMMRETLRSLHAWGEGAAWLGDNLVALGRSHWEYGVTSDMYDDFVATMLSCAREMLGDAFDAARSAALHAALDGIVQPMRSAGESRGEHGL